jgi:hypothetical protein
MKKGGRGRYSPLIQKTPGPRVRDIIIIYHDRDDNNVDGNKVMTGAVNTSWGMASLELVW